MGGTKYMKKRIVSLLVAAAMLTMMLPSAFAASTVTRAEWIEQLVDALSMTVESDDNMPDNYFSDISEDDSYYRDILVAVEFGVIDLEEGEDFEPTKSATREFAAQTLNSALQFQLDEDSSYTFSESGDVTYPDDIQVAINRGWFALSGGKALPYTAITSAEATAMLDDAKAVIADEAVDENYNSTYTFASGVKEIPKDTDVTIGSDNTVTITDYENIISDGDIFVVYNSGYPVPFKAVSVEKNDNQTIITTTKDGTDDAILSADAEGEIDVDLENFEADELTTYSVTNTKTDEVEEMSVELQSINYDNNTKTLTVSKKISLGSAAAGTVTAKLNNIKLSHKEKITQGQAEAIVTANSTVTTEVSFDFGDYAGIPSSLELGSIPVAGVGKIALSMDYSLKGGVAMTWKGVVKAGVTYNNGDLRIVKGYKKTGFSFTAEAAITAGLKLSAGVDLKAIKGIIYATVGVKMNFSVKGFDSGTPKTCVTIKGYLYATVGADVSVFGKSIPIKPQEIFNESNSPVRAVYHYEDNVLVKGCTRGLNIKYTTSTGSKYFNPSPSYGNGSYGGGSGTSEPVVIWEYEVDDDGNATITSYKGTASAVAVPSTIDGYKVTKIGSSAFENNKNLYSVTMPNSVTEIGNYAFERCKNLSNLKLPSNITTLGIYVFKGCDALTEIYIPKTVKDSICPFDESGIETAEFESGMTKIPSSIFQGASKLKNVKIPETVTEIGNYAFERCKNLSNLKLPSNITTLGIYVFKGCDALNNVSIPDSVTSIGSQAFYGCDTLSDVQFGIGVKEIPDSAFRQCPSLVEITLPRYCTKVASNAFAENTKMTKVTVFPSMTSIENNSFSYPAKMTMRGVLGSYAQTYAKNRNMTFEAINNPITGLKFYKDSLDFSGTWETKVLPLSIAPSDGTEDITYTSADENIATVENGVVKSVGYGTTTITAQSGSRKATITINVLRSANSVSLDKTELSMEVGDKATLKATMNPSNATDKLTWSTSNANVVKVDNGNVTAVGAGKATVIVTTTSGKTASCTVEVTGSFTITAEAGENGTISPLGVKSVKSNEKVTYNITPNYGYVVKDVFVNGKSVGAVETYTFNGITADSTIKAEFAKVNVTYANNSISISSNAELKNLKLIVAEYDDNNVLTNCNVKTVSANAGKAYTDTIKSKPNMKIMLWNSFDNMRPIWCN